ncbi:MAG: phosphatidate cytidylyltransferase [Planctomycetota bacterium]|jgi:phosphatidate cytidylyltransferase
MMEWLSDAAASMRHPGPLGLMVGITIGLLVAATLVIGWLSHGRPPAATRELRLRVRSWWVMIIVFLAAILVDDRLSLLFIALLSYLALKEFFTLVHLRLADRRAMLLAYLAIPLQYLWVYLDWYEMFIVFIPVFMFLVIPLWLILAGETHRFMTSLGKLQWGLMAFVFCLSHLAFMLVMDHDIGTEFAAGNRGLVCYVVFLAQFNDVLQYAVGKTLGRRPLTPSISPNKTWEGFLGGLAGTTALAVALRFLTPLDITHAIGAGLLIGALGPVGDVVISAIKRDAGVKDSGALIPGHGGLLDRVDSLCFSVPVFFHYVGYLY